VKRIFSKKEQKVFRKARSYNAHNCIYIIMHHSRYEDPIVARGFVYIVDETWSPARTSESEGNDVLIEQQSTG
jgi:hypothetical protein